VVGIRWPVPWDGTPNDFEIVGRYLAQTILMERFVDMILLHDGVKPAVLKRTRLSNKIEQVGEIIARPDLDLREWDDLPDLMRKVTQHRNAFAHRLMERGALPPHYGQGIPYVRLTEEELGDQVREAFVASEVCRQLTERLTLASLYPGRRFRRRDPRWPLT
jgi:hypothetical protein